jgi:basic amino acid/polyamine antiporter, APA family
MTVDDHGEAPGLLRKLDLKDTTFLAIGSMVGSGIFLTSSKMASHVSSPGALLLVWLIGGFFALCGALTFAELGVMFPRAGGQYVYVREAYGNFAGFYYGWGFFWFIQCGANAALAVAFAEYLGYFLPFLSTDFYLIQATVLGFHYTLSAGQLVAIASIAMLTAINLYGVKSGARVQNLLTYIRIVSLALIIGLGLALGNKNGITHVSQLFSGTEGFNLATLMPFGLALIAALWTYDGWYSINCAAGEVKQPERTIPLALLIATLSVTIIYLLVNIVYITALPFEQIRLAPRIGEQAVLQLFGRGAASVISLAIMISIFGCLSATILYGPRVFLAMAKDGLFFESMTRIHPKYHVPSTALIGQALWSCLLCLTGTFESLYEYVVFALVIFFALTGFSVILLRYRQPDRERSYRTWGYPVIPLFFVLANCAIFLNIVVTEPRKSMIGLLILSLGLPAYFYWRNKKKDGGGSEAGAE